MLRKMLVALIAVVLFGAAFARPAQAQSQAVSFNIGYFAVRGLEARANTDIAKNELLLGGPQDLLLYNGQQPPSVKGFNNATFGADWLFGLGDFLEGGIGVAYYAKTVPSISLNYVNIDESEITQNLKLRIVPITATIRFLPLARRAAVEPYIGAGLGAFIWHYSEVGQFVDANENIFSSSFVSSGTKIGPVVLAGVRVPFGPYAIGGEWRYQRAEGKLDPNVFGALASTVDLGGNTIQANFTIRFGG